jgi:hypothetical protein
MPYGHPSPSGHGRRIPAYRWSPSVVPPSRRHASKKRRGRPPATRISPVTRVPAGCGASDASLFKETAASLAKGCARVVADFLDGPRHGPNAFTALLGDILLIDVMLSSPICFVVFGALWLVNHLDDFAADATEEAVKDYEEANGRMCIHRKTSVNAPPSPEALRRAWEAAHGARGSLAGKLLAGTLLSDLEPAVDQTYVRAGDGTIVGRRPGLKGWMRVNCPDLVPHYKALMSYKALADKLRKALGIEEPDTLDGVIDFGSVAQEGGASPGGGEVSGEGKGTPDRVGRTPKSLHFRECYRLMNTIHETVKNRLLSIFGCAGGTGESSTAAAFKGAGEPSTVMAFKGTGGPQTAVALEGAVRECLGLCWMQRRGRTSTRTA